MLIRVIETERDKKIKKQILLQKKNRENKKTPYKTRIQENYITK